MQTLEYLDIQGLVLRGYGEKPEAAFLPLRFVDRDKAGAWLATVEPTSAELGYRPEVSAETRRAARTEEVTANLAVTARGLRALGYSREELSCTFTEAFAVGMSAERTRHILNDQDPSAWRWSDADGGRGVDALWLVYASSAAALETHLASFRTQADARGLEIVDAPLRAAPRSDDEPFGFRDGIAQPQLSHRAGDGGLAAGEIILGYPDEQGRDNAYQSVGAIEGLLTNGSYLVLRELVQDVRGFWEAIARHVGPRPAAIDARLRLAAKLVGRWPSGSPLVGGEAEDPKTATDELDSFGYRDGDPHGLGCPIGAHVRRMNPRDWLFGSSAAHALGVVSRRRMLRRGRAFGTPTGRSAEQLAAAPEEIPDGDRGLYFIGLVANLERQFEFLQQTWANDPSFAGLSQNPDPLIGRAPSRRMVIQAEPVRERTAPLPEFVTVRGGGYFFLPGIRALRAMGARAAAQSMTVPGSEASTDH